MELRDEDLVTRMRDNPVRAKCGECKFEGWLADFHSEETSEGWEYPTYTVHICPVCYAYIDNYIY